MQELRQRELRGCTLTPRLFHPASSQLAADTAGTVDGAEHCSMVHMHIFMIDQVPLLIRFANARGASYALLPASRGDAKPTSIPHVGNVSPVDPSRAPDIPLLHAGPSGCTSALNSTSAEPGTLPRSIMQGLRLSRVALALPTLRSSPRPGRQRKSRWSRWQQASAHRDV